MSLNQSNQGNESYLILLLITGMVIGFCLIRPIGTLRFTYDSYDYVQASESFSQYVEGRNQDGHPYLARAPLLPLYLGMFNNKTLAAWCLNIICFVTGLLLIYKIGRALTLAFPILVGLIVVTGLSYPWLLNHFFLWTEPLFSTLILTLVYALIKNKSFVVICILCLFLMFTRKAGIIIDAGVVVFFLFARNYRIGFSLSAIILICASLWELITMHYLQKPASVFQVAAMMDFSRSHLADAFTAWWFPRVIPLWIRLLLLVTVIAMIVVLLRKEVSIFLKSQNNQLLVTLAGAYLVSVFVLLGAADYSDAERFLSVLLPVFMIAVFSFGNQLTLNFQKRKWPIMAGIGTWMLYPIVRTIFNLISQ